MIRNRNELRDQSKKLLQDRCMTSGRLQLLRWPAPWDDIWLGILCIKIQPPYLSWKYLYVGNFPHIKMGPWGSAKPCTAAQASGGVMDLGAAQRLQGGRAQLAHWPQSDGIRDSSRDRFVYAPSQWETTLQCNVVSNWLSTYPKWSLLQGKQNMDHSASMETGIFWNYFPANYINNENVV